MWAAATPWAKRGSMGCGDTMDCADPLSCARRRPLMSMLPPPPASWLKANKSQESTVAAWPSIRTRRTPSMEGDEGRGKRGGHKDGNASRNCCEGHRCVRAHCPRHKPGLEFSGPRTFTAHQPPQVLPRSQNDDFGLFQGRQRTTLATTQARTKTLNCVQECNVSWAVASARAAESPVAAAMACVA